jgi:hypothetical protein
MRVDIRQNLWLALVNLRDHRQERVLWIDAICINQMDLDERNHQVKLMAYIFSRAQEVLVWLGLINTIVPVNFEPHEEKQRQDEIVELCIKPYWKRVWIVQVRSLRVTPYPFLVGICEFKKHLQLSISLND